MGYKVN